MRAIGLVYLSEKKLPGIKSPAPFRPRSFPFAAPLSPHPHSSPIKSLLIPSHTFPYLPPLRCYLRLRNGKPSRTTYSFRPAGLVMQSTKRSSIIDGNDSHLHAPAPPLPSFSLPDPFFGFSFTLLPPQRTNDNDKTTGSLAIALRGTTATHPTQGTIGNP